MQELSRLAAQGQLGRPRVLEDRALVFERGEAAAAAYFLSEGTVEIFQHTDEGFALVVRLLCGPCLFGILETAGAEPRYLESMRVLDHAVLYRVPTEKLFTLLKTQPVLTREILATTAMAFCRVADTEMGRLADTEELLAAALCVYADLYGEDTAAGRRIRLRRSLADLAAVVGASERQVQRLLAAWKKRRWVDKVAARYVVKDRSALAELAHGFEKGWVHRVTEVPSWVYGQ